MLALQSLQYLLLLIGIMSTCSVGAHRFVTREELESKTGENGSDVWLSILGEVYDVTAGRDYYGPGASYNMLASRDSSVPFITGTFTLEEADKDPVALNDADLAALVEWRKFYSENEKYPFVGLLLDPRYYDNSGATRPSLSNINTRIKRITSE